MSISVIIPTYNEEPCIGVSIEAVASHSDGGVGEIIIADGGSSDATIDIASKARARVVVSPQKGRASQMNYGASVAEGELLYFLHADSIPPPNFDRLILDQAEVGCRAGCFQLAFNRKHWLLDFYGWCTRFDIDLFRFGDQSLFIERELFNKIGGFREDHMLMEDQEIIERIREESTFRLLPEKVITSARRYEENGMLRLQLIFTLIVILYKMGFSQQKLLSVYRKLVY